MSEEQKEENEQTTVSGLDDPSCYRFCEFFPDVAIGQTFHLLGNKFVKTGKTTARKCGQSLWVFDKDKNEISQR